MNICRRFFISIAMSSEEPINKKCTRTNKTSNGGYRLINDVNFKHQGTQDSIGNSNANRHLRQKELLTSNNYRKVSLERRIPTLNCWGNEGVSVSAIQCKWVGAYHREHFLKVGVSD